MFPIYDSEGEPVGLRRPRARRRRPEVQELARDADLPEEPAALRAQLGEGRDRRPGRGRHLRGLHRRDGVRARRRAQRGRDLRHRARRRPLPDRSRTSPARSMLAYDADTAGQGAAERGTGGSSATRSQLEVADLPPGSDPADVWRDDPAALAARGRSARRRSSQFRVDRAARRRPTSPRLEGRARAGRGRGRDRRRAPERARARPVRHAAGRAARHRRRPAARRGRRAARGSGAAPRRRGDAPPSRASAPPTRRARVASTGASSTCCCWAVHEPELVVDWLDAALFVDPIARARVRAARRRRRLPRGARREPTDRCATCSSGSRSRSRSSDDEPETLARAADGEHRRTGRAARAHGDAPRRRRPRDDGEAAARRARARRENRRLGRGRSATRRSW